MPATNATTFTFIKLDIAYSDKNETYTLPCCGHQVPTTQGFPYRQGASAHYYIGIDPAGKTGVRFGTEVPRTITVKNHTLEAPKIEYDSGQIACPSCGTILCSPGTLKFADDKPPMTPRTIATAILVTAIFLLLAFTAKPAHAAPWTKTRTTAEIREACDYYHLTEADTRWLISAGIDIIYRLPGKPRHESSGCKHTKNHHGILQFDNDWHLTKNLRKRAKRLHHNHADGWRCCRDCSIHRYVKVYKTVKKQKGAAAARAKIHAKWRATLGR